MSLIIKTSIVFFLLVVSIDTMSGVLQQPQPGLLHQSSFTITDPFSITAAATPVEIEGTLRTDPDADSSFNNIDIRYKAALDRIKQQAATLGKYADKNNYSTEYLFLVDMSLPSGKNRFFVYNLKKDAIETASLVTHGVGSNKYNNDDPLQFSNMPYSLKTSLGKYKIGNSYYGRFGLAYKLYGLDSTNNNAFERAIVMHAHKEVPDTEIFPDYIIVSSGCPTVSPGFLATLNKYIKASKKPILLWIYQ